MATVAGVYAIHNLVTGEFYIGSSVNMRDRFNQHRYQLRKGIHHNGRLQRAWNLNPAVFVLEPLCLTDSPRDTEQRLLNRLACHPKCLNLSLVVEGFPEWTPERRQAAGERSRRRKRMPWSSEARERLSSYRRAALATPEARAREAAKFQGAPNGMRGKQLSPDARAKIAARARGRVAWNKGRAHSEETRRKIAERWTLNRTERCEAISQSKKGKTLSTQTRERMSESHRRRAREKGFALADQRRAQTHCIYGHELSGINVRLSKGGKRACIECAKRRSRQQDAKRKLARALARARAA